MAIRPPEVSTVVPSGKSGRPAASVESAVRSKDIACEHKSEILIADGGAGSAAGKGAESARCSQDYAAFGCSVQAENEMFGSMVLMPAPCDDVYEEPERCSAEAGMDCARSQQVEAKQTEELIPSSPSSSKQDADRTLRRAAALAKRAAAAVAKAESGWLSGEAGATSWPSVDRSVGADESATTACGPAQRSGVIGLARLPQVHEDRSTEFDFGITFIVPRGQEGEEFMAYIVAAFPEGRADASSPFCFVLVPYGGDKTALVALQQLGPVEALEQARRCGPKPPNCGRERGPQGACGQASFASQDTQPELCSAESPGIWKRKGLPETADEMSARSTAIAYMVHAFRSAEDAEQQLGPICSVEASYRNAALRHRPRRFLIALHDQEPGQVERPVDFGRPGPLGRDVLKKLQHRGHRDLPCTAITRGDISGHQALVIQIVEALAAQFRQGGSAEEKYENSVVGSETTAGSSMCTTPQTSPLSSLSTPAMPQGGLSNPAMQQGQPNSR